MIWMLEVCINIDGSWGRDSQYIDEFFLHDMILGIGKGWFKKRRRKGWIDMIFRNRRVRLRRRGGSFGLEGGGVLLNRRE